MNMKEYFTKNRIVKFLIFFAIAYTTLVSLLSAIFPAERGHFLIILSYVIYHITFAITITLLLLTILWNISPPKEKEEPPQKSILELKNTLQSKLKWDTDLPSWKDIIKRISFYGMIIATFLFLLISVMMVIGDQESGDTIDYIAFPPMHSFFLPIFLSLLVIWLSFGLKKEHKEVNYYLFAGLIVNVLLESWYILSIRFLKDNPNIFLLFYFLLPFPIIAVVLMIVQQYSLSEKNK